VQFKNISSGIQSGNLTIIKFFCLFFVQQFNEKYIPGASGLHTYSLEWNRKEGEA
jgi:hypothetical protein